MTISTKKDIQQWLLEKGVYIPYDDIPEVKHLRQSKWVDFEDDFDDLWIGESVYLILTQEQRAFLKRDGRLSRLELALEILRQGDKARIRFMRGRVISNRFYTRVSKLPELVVDADEILRCTNMQAIISVIRNCQDFKYNITLGEN